MGGRGASSGTAGSTAKGGITGSEKQVAWATKIRDQAQPLYQQHVNEAMRNPSPGMRLPGGKQAFVKAYSEAWNKQNNSHASWWIDQRSGHVAANAIAREAHSSFTQWIRKKMS